MADAPAPKEPEVDVWWGSFSGWAGLPVFLALLAATGIHVFVFESGVLGTWRWRWIALFALPAWLAVFTWWLYHVFSQNYRITTKRLYREEGVWRPIRTITELADIREVRVVRKPLTAWMGLGDVIAVGADPKNAVRFQAVSNPGLVAERIRDLLDVRPGRIANTIR